MHAVSANKGPVVHGFDELSRLALRHNARYLFESAVMDGVPIFNLGQCCLPAATLRSFRGILNSTTNIILSGMAAGRPYAECLAAAQVRDSNCTVAQ